MRYEKAFKDIEKTVGGWITDTLYNKESSADDIKVALTYLVAMVETYAFAIKDWSDIDDKDR